MIKRLLAWLHRLFTRPAARIGMGVLVTVSFIAGAFFWHYFNVGMEATNEESFCISCHTMGDNLLPELQKTVHWQNRTGVRARCPDCHVPHDFTDKVARKMQASREVWGHIVGTIGTREKFKEHRIVLATRMGTLQGEQFQGMPQLPRLQQHGFLKDARHLPDGDAARGRA